MRTLLWGGFVVVVYVVVMLANLVFLYAYNSAFELWLNGERVMVKPVELVRGPGGGNRGYTYNVERGTEIDEIHSNTKFELNVASSVVINPDRPRVVYKLDGGYGILAAYKAVMGGWFLSIVLVIMHIGILKVTWSLFVELPFESVRASRQANRLN